MTLTGSYSKKDRRIIEGAGLDSTGAVAQAAFEVLVVLADRRLTAGRVVSAASVLARKLDAEVRFAVAGHSAVGTCPVVLRDTDADPSPMLLHVSAAGLRLRDTEAPIDYAKATEPTDTLRGKLRFARRRRSSTETLRVTFEPDVSYGSLAEGLAAAGSGEEAPYERVRLER